MRESARCWEPRFAWCQHFGRSPSAGNAGDRFLRAERDASCAASSPLASHQFLSKPGTVCPHWDLSLPSRYLRDIWAGTDLV